MLNLTKPQRLRRGDLVATVSLSWGGAGDPSILWRYEQEKSDYKTYSGLKLLKCLIHLPNQTMFTNIRRRGRKI